MAELHALQDQQRWPNGAPAKALSNSEVPQSQVPHLFVQGQDRAGNPGEVRMTPREQLIRDIEAASLDVQRGEA